MTVQASPRKGGIALTGATGYIGRATVQAALSRGYGVVAFGRRPLDVPGVGFQHYDLKDEGALGIPPGCVAILHLAADTHAGSRADIDMEMKAAIRIVGAAREYGLPLVFVSSQTAAPDAATDYGRAKWYIEQIVLEASGCIVRPGLVYGGEARGLFGQLSGLVKTLPVLPSFLPAPVVQPIHVNDLAAGLVQTVEQRSAGVISLAQDNAVSFTRFLRIVASDRMRRPRIFVPFPAFVLSLIAPIAAAVPGTPDLGRIRSLYAMNEMRTAADLQKLGIRTPQP
ncbi:NAD-dependent epimerase/dehydratase family protein [Rhodopseudomonas sp. P2A-2r]|uniref:NAD-dependent epimerase/dehydratase family protein n=1 Tax=Rhodopseudomonas sp. P2A-2r TaxID=2991972 RepID=UPI002233F6F7|nr:NAD-dependent epimerase/dehydratase family protein [Rhodopseudomonas sp. P2A-2r]UZE48108.1 NAD-dependent epimerase/dehydratase family protein [Rhodopseudomonas sp. P2A-2r]